MKVAFFEGKIDSVNVLVQAVSSCVYLIFVLHLVLGYPEPDGRESTGKRV